VLTAAYDAIWTRYIIEIIKVKIIACIRVALVIVVVVVVGLG
jgi:hypothetical protein